MAFNVLKVMPAFAFTLLLSTMISVCIAGHLPSMLRVGIIGAGANTKLHHIPKLQAMDGVRVTHVVNRSPASSKLVQNEFNIPNISDSWEDLVASNDVDALCVGTWPYTHADMAIKTLEAGKHVLVEARMAMNASQAADMLMSARDHPELAAMVVPSPLTLKFDKTVARMVKEGETTYHAKPYSLDS